MSLKYYESPFHASYDIKEATLMCKKIDKQLAIQLIKRQPFFK